MIGNNRGALLFRGRALGDDPTLPKTIPMLDGPPFLSVLVHRPDAALEVQSGKHVVGLTGLCAGYDSGAWRGEQLAEYLIET